MIASLVTLIESDKNKNLQTYKSYVGCSTEKYYCRQPGYHSIKVYRRPEVLRPYLSISLPFRVLACPILFNFTCFHSLIYNITQQSPNLCKNMSTKKIFLINQHYTA